MADSLLLGYAELMQEVGAWLGYGRDIVRLTRDQKIATDAMIQAGLRSFYWQPGIQWSFLQPLITVVTADGVDNVPLPEDYAGIVGHITFVSTTTTYSKIMHVSEGQVREQLALHPGLEGIPTIACVRPLSMAPTSGQRFTLGLFPKPDAVYTLRLQINVAPGKLSDKNPFPYGGPVHSETIKAACLAAAEKEMGDTVGVMAAKYAECLSASVASDARMHRGQYLGYNGDPSSFGDSENWWRRDPHDVTYQGVQY